MRYDVVIIGGGLSGLMCAALLSRAGKSVVVLEQGMRPGGCIQSYWRGGRAFDTGFHYVGGLGEGQPLRRAFDYLGLMRLPWHRLDTEGFDRVMIGGRDFWFAEGYEAFADRLSEDFPTERAALRQYAAMLRQSETWRTDIPGTTDSMAWLYETGAYPYLTKTFRDPLLVNVLSGTSLKMELRRVSLPLFTFAHANASYVSSSWRLRGDGGQITDALAQSLSDHGGKMVCRARVTELTERDGRITAARCDNGEAYVGDVFVSSVHPAVTCELVNPRMKGFFPLRIGCLENTFGMVTVSLRLRPRTVRYFNYNQYIYRKPNVWTFYEDVGGVGGVMVSCRVPMDGGKWAEQIDLLTPATWDRWRQWSNTSVGRRGKDYETAKNRVADACVELAERFLPGLSAKVTQRYISTPLTYHDYTLAPQGTAYGVRKDCRHPLMTILSSRTPLPNLLLTGQSLVMHGLQGVTMTTFQTCAGILGDDYIRKMI